MSSHGAMQGGITSPYSMFSGTGRSSDFFPSPWLDVASASMPDTNKNALEWSEYVWGNNGTYRMAQERVISYFLTDIELGSVDPRKPFGDDEKERYETFMAETLHILDVIQCLNRDRAAYGNGFGSMMVPFKRFLVCPKTGLQYALREMFDNPEAFRFEYDAAKNEFRATCPISKWRGAWLVNDQPDDLEKKLRVKLWSPHEMEIHCDPWTGDAEYYWKIPEEYKRSIRKSDIFLLERAPTEILKAVQKNWLFKFAPGSLFHMKEPTLGGMKTRGWGISRTLTNFRDVWYVQVLRRYNEAIALDYIIPFRLITPELRSSGGQSAGETGDPLRMTDLGDLGGLVRRMLRKRRRDPASWHFLPFPVKYQALGGEASELIPRDLIDQGYETLLNASGTPPELYSGSLQLQTAPVSLRLFEATHHSLVNDNNRFLSWLVDQVSQLLSLPVVQARMKRVTHADDFNKQMALLQLMMGQTISQTSGLKAIGLDYKDEQRIIAEEASYQQRLQAEIQEEMEQAAFGEQIAKGQMMPGMPPGGGMGGGMGGEMAGGMGGGMPPGGDPAMMGAGGGMGMGGGPVTGMLMGPHTAQTPQDMLAEAESIADALLGLPESQKLSELHALKQKNEVLHAIVTQKIRQKRQQAQTAGGSMLLGQTSPQPMM